MSDAGARSDADVGHEVLVVDRDPGVLKAIERLFAGTNISVTSLTDLDRARNQVANRFISVVLLDLDTPEPGAGIELVKFIRAEAPLTTPIVMTSRKAYEAVAPAFRAGAADVIPKSQEAVVYMRDRVIAAAVEVRTQKGRERLLRDVADMHEEFLKKMMELARQITDLEDKLLARDAGGSSTMSGLGPINLLLIDDDPALGLGLERDLPASKGWRLRHAQSGGEGLDAATQSPPQVVLVKDQLPDLPGSMVVKTIKSDLPEVIALLFAPPTEEATGEVKLVENSRMVSLIPSFSDPDQLVTALADVRDALRQKAKDRRYLQNFRNQHYEFLSRYNALKQRLAPRRAGES